MGPFSIHVSFAVLDFPRYAQINGRKNAKTREN
jgi:hypothetical protein